MTSEGFPQPNADKNKEETLSANRREALKIVAGGIGAASLETGPVHAARPEEHQTPEQLRAYNEGLDQMQREAATATTEEQRFFITRRDGSTLWLQPKNEKTGSLHLEAGTPEATSLAWIEEDKESERELEAEIAAGARVRDLHTHPTKAMLDNAERESPEPGTDKVPPSGVDILRALRETAREPEGTQRTYEVVTEAGVWEYGAVSRKAARELNGIFETATPTVRRLEHDLRPQGLEFAGYLRKKAAEMGDDEDAATLYTAAAEGIENGSIKGIEGNPDAIASFAAFAALVKNEPDFPLRAKVYVAAIESANRETSEALSKFAPLSAGGVDAIPSLEDTDAYVEDWKRLGVQIKFTPRQPQ